MFSNSITNTKNFTVDEMYINTSLGTPHLTTSQIVQLTPQVGQLVYDTLLNKLFVYTNVGWVTYGTSGDVTNLQNQITDVSNNLATNYYNKTQVDSKETNLNNKITDVSNNLFNNYYNKTTIDNNIYTKTQSDNLLNNKLDVSGNQTLTITNIDNSGNILNLGNNANSINVGCGSNIQTINMGSNSSTGVTTINIGGAGDTVNVAGTLNYIQTTDLKVTDNNIILNAGSSGSATARGAGISIRDNNNDNQAYIKVSSLGTIYEIKAPENSFVLSTPILTQNETIASQTFVNTGLSGKVDTSTLSNYYTQTQTNNLLANKADTSSLSNYVLKAGDTMTGTLIVNNDIYAGIPTAQARIYTSTLWGGYNNATISGQQSLIMLENPHIPYTISAGSSRLRFASDSSTTSVYDISCKNGNMYVGYGNVDKITIDQNGSLSTNALIYLRTDAQIGGTANYYLIDKSGNNKGQWALGSAGTAFDFAIYSYSNTGAFERQHFNIEKTTGNIGIGTTANDAKLVVGGSIKLGDDGNNPIGSIRYSSNQFIARNSAGQFYLYKTFHIKFSKYNGGTTVYSSNGVSISGVSGNELNLSYATNFNSEPVVLCQSEHLSIYGNPAVYYQVVNGQNGVSIIRLYNSSWSALNWDFFGSSGQHITNILVSGI